MTDKAKFPSTPAEVRKFINVHCSVLEFGADSGVPSDNDKYTLSAHDLISAFRWWIADEGAGGVQALSAAPEMGDVDWPDVEDLAHSCLQEALSFGLGHDVIHRWMRAVMDKTAAAMLAASPTPPAEQPAQPGAVYAKLPEALLVQYDEIDCEEFGCFAAAQMRDFADRTHALRMQAAPKAAPGRSKNRYCGCGMCLDTDEKHDSGCPKAAPGEPSVEGLQHQLKLLAEALGACILASGIVRKDIDGFTGPQLLHFSEDLRSMLEAAPKPAPAPLNERDAFESAWAKLHGRPPILWSQMFAQHKMKTPAHSEGKYFFGEAQAAWTLWQARAALAAQGGRDA